MFYIQISAEAFNFYYYLVYVSNYEGIKKKKVIFFEFENTLKNLYNYVSFLKGLLIKILLLINIS